MFLLDLLSYPRSILISLVGLIHTGLMSVVVLILAATTKSRRVVDFAIIYLWSMFLIKASNIKVEVKGLENVTEDGKGFLILFNHSSLMDIPILYAYFPRSFRFGAKIELFKIPFFGKAMELCGVLPIDRSNRNKVMKVYENAISRVNRGEAFALAPEGTRQKQSTLGRFKRGPFEFAINAQMDLIPAVMAGVYDVLPRKGLFINAGRWRRKVILEILPRVPTAGLTMEQLDSLVQKVHDQMDKVFVQLNEELKGF